MKKFGSILSILLIFFVSIFVFNSMSSFLGNKPVYAQEESGSSIFKTHKDGLWSSIKSWFTPNKSIIKSDSFLGKSLNNIEENKEKSTKSFDIFSKNCVHIDFVDINGHIYKKNIQSLEKDCIVKGTIKENHFYPDNFARRSDILTMFAKSYQEYFIDTKKGINLVYFDDVKTGTVLFQIVQASNYMGIVDLLIGKNKKKIGLDEFVLKSDVVRIMTLLHTIKPNISNKGLEKILGKKGYITRGELAYIVSVSLNKNIESNKPIIKKVEKNDKTIKEVIGLDKYPGMKFLVERGILNKYDELVKHPEYAITRKQFLKLIVKIKSNVEPGIPVGVQNMNYFADVKEGSGNSILTQAKNLGLTSFLEESVRGKLYLKPTKFVSQYESAVILNKIAQNKSKEDKNTDTLYIQNEKAAEMALIAFGLKKTYDFNKNQKVEIGNITSKVKGRFWTE